MATTGTASVGSGVTADVSGSGTLELAGSVSALGTTIVAARATVKVESTASTLLVSTGNQQVGGIDGSGTVQISPPTGQSDSLTADHITAGSLILGGDATSSAVVTIAASNPDGTSMAQSTEFRWLRGLRFRRATRSPATHKVRRACWPWTLHRKPTRTSADRRSAASKLAAISRQCPSLRRWCCCLWGVSLACWGPCGDGFDNSERHFVAVCVEATATTMCALPINNLSVGGVLDSRRSA